MSKMKYLIQNKKQKFSIKIILFIIFCIIIFYISFFGSINEYRTDPIYIGVAAPMNSKNKAQSMEMLKGINLCVEMINKKGGIKNRAITLAIKNDKNDKSAAMKVASEFALDDRIVVILGHYLSSNSIVAGNIYQKSGIPVITATSASEEVTFGNEWYFSIITGNSFQSDFVANYIKSYINTKQAVIIVDKNEYENTSLARNFQMSAGSNGIEIKKIWEIDSSSSSLNDRIKTISNELQFIENPGAIFIASQAKEAVQIITTIKKLGANYHIIGPSSFANKSFIDTFNEYPRERAIKGYYSDNIHVFVPYIPQMYNASIYNFNKEYVNKYGELPSWIAVGYHDAMYVALEAIKKVSNNSNEPINQIRQKVRKKLSEFDCYEHSVSGFLGPLYFNDNGVVEKSLKFGIYKNQKLIPSYSQFYLLSEKNKNISNNKEAELIKIYDRMAQNVKIVYTGIDLIEILNIDLNKLTCIADLYLWFRYKGNFNHSNIVFSNTINPIKLNKKIFSETHNDITYVLYSIAEQFKISSDSTFFPFESHSLKISFHHADYAKDRLIYVSDNIENINREKIIFNGFDISNIQMFQSTYVDNEISQFENLSDSNTFSEFNIKAKIKRQDIFFKYRYLIPLLISFCILILSYYIQNYQKYFLILSSFIITGIFNIKVLQDISTTDILQIKLVFLISYLCMTIYLLILITNDWKNRINSNRI